MKDFNFLRKPERVNEGSTLALTVVSPSFDRRSTVVKHLAFMLLFLLGSLNVWGADVTVSWTASTNSLGSLISEVNGTASGTIATTATNLSYDWSYTRTLVSLANNKSDYCQMDGEFMHLGSGNALESIEISTSNIPGTIKSVSVVAAGDKHNIAITVGSSTYLASTALAAWSGYDGAAKSGTGTSSGTITISIAPNSNTKKAVYIKSISVTYNNDGGTPVCATPTFSPVAGAVASGTNVSISSTTEGATIYYTTDGITEPTTSSATSQPIEITAATTIKAIAVKGGYDNSDVATAAYTIATPKTIAQIMPTSETEGDAFLLNDVTVTYAYGSNVYVKDESGYILVYDKNSAITGAANGKVLHGLWGKAKLYNGLPEISTVTQAPTVTDGSAVVPEELDAYPTDDDLNKYVTLEGVTFAAAATLSGSVINVTGTFDASDLIFRNTFKLDGISLATGKSYRIVGVVQKYNSDYQVYPITIDEETEEGAPEAPTFSPAAGTYTSVQSVELSCATEGATIYYTTNGDTPDNTSTGYTAAISVGENMTIKAIAIKNEKTSSVASAAYVINLPEDENVRKTWDLSTDSYVKDPEPTASLIQWTATYVSMTNEKTGTETGVNNYIPTTRTSTRFYGGNRLTITPSGKQLTTIVFTATSESYATALANSDWTNATASASGSTVTVTASGPGAVVASVGGTCGFTAVQVNYTDITTKTVTITTPNPSEGTLVVKDGEDPISSGDAVAVGSTLTIVATPQSGYTLGTVSVIDEDSDPVTVTENTFVVPSKNVTVSATFNVDVTPDASLTLWENGNEVPFGGSHKQGDHVTLPTSVTHNCANRVFVGWSAVEVAQTDVKPAYNEPGADFVLNAAGENTLYAVYAAVATPASYQKLESDAFETTASYVIGAEQAAGNTKMWYLSSYSNTDVNINWGVMTDDPATTAPVVFTLSGTADALVAQDAAGNYLAGLNTGKFKMSSTSTTVSLSDAGIIGTTNSYVLRHNYNGGNGGLRWYAGTTGTSAYFYKVVAPTYNKYSTSCDEAIDAPEFTPAEGTYTEAKSVSITAADGATIYYTMTEDGSTPADPTKSSDVYSTAIPLNAAGTYKFKAFAVKGEAESDITSATYTMNLPLTTIPAVFAKATAVGSTETEVTVVFDNWVVSGIGGADNKNVFVTDGTNGFIIFGASHGFAVNDKLSGSVTANLKLYNGAAELLAVKASDITTLSHDGEVTPVVKTIDELGGVNTGAPIIVNNVKFDGTNLTDGTNNIQPYTTLYDYTDPSSPFQTNRYYNVTGIYTQFGSKKEILPRSAADIEELAQTAPTMTWYTSSAKTATIAANATYSIDLGDSFAPVFETNSSGTLTYSSNNDAVATINATTGALTLEGGTGDVLITCAVAEDAVNNFTAGSHSFTLRVREGATVDYVVILAQYNGIWYAMKNDGIPNKTAAAIEVAYSDGKIWNLSTTDQEAITWKRTIDGDNVTFQASNDDYLKTSSNDLAQGAGESGSYQWNWNSTYYRTGTQERTFVYRAGTINGFRSYSVNNAGTNDYSALPVITAAVFADGEYYTEVRSGLEINRYYTICLPKQVTAVQGGTFWKLRYKDAEPATMAYLEEETAPFEAGAPYIFQATATELAVVYSGDAVTEPIENGALRGTFTTIATSAFASLPGNVYLLINNKICPRTTGNYLSANRAYVDYDALTINTPNAAPGKRVRAIPMQGNTATSMDELNAAEAPVKIMIDGTMYILRGEKMYDATGRLVK